jgi:hypothetical protein
MSSVAAEAAASILSTRPGIFSTFVGHFFALLDPDPDPLTRLNPDPIRIRIRYPDLHNVVMYQAGCTLSNKNHSPV